MRGRIFTLFILLAQFSFAQSCFTEFSYYRGLDVINPEASLLTDIQVSFQLETATLLDSSKLTADGSDLRITDENCQPVPFYIVSVSDSGTSTIWMKLDSLPSNDTLHLQLYYGNDTVQTASSGDSTFIFFDDFSLDSVDVNKWEPIGEFDRFRTNNGIFEYSSTFGNQNSRFKFARTRMNFSEEAIFEFNARISNSNGFGFSSTDSILERIIFRQSGFGFDTLNQVAWNTDTLSNGVSISQVYPIIRYPRGDYTDGRLRAGIENDTLKVFEFSNLTDSSYNNDTFELTQTKMSAFHFIVSAFTSQTIFMDYLWARKPGGDSVQFAFGAELMLVDTTGTDTTTTNLTQGLDFAEA